MYNTITIVKESINFEHQISASTLDQSLELLAKEVNTCDYGDFVEFDDFVFYKKMRNTVRVRDRLTGFSVTKRGIDCYHAIKKAIEDLNFYREQMYNAPHAWKINLLDK